MPKLLWEIIALALTIAFGLVRRPKFPPVQNPEPVVRPWENHTLEELVDERVPDFGENWKKDTMQRLESERHRKGKKRKP